MFGFLGAPFLLIVAVVLLALAGKSEDDPRRERPAALYLSTLTLVGVLAVLAGTFLAVNGLVELTDTKPSGWTSYSERIEVGGEFEFGPDMRQRGRRLQPLPPVARPGANHDDDVSQLIGGLIVGAVGLALLRFHVPKLQDLADNSEGPGARVYSRLLYIVSGVALLTGLGAAGSALYAVYGMIAPDTAGAGEVTDALRALITALAVATVAWALFREAWSKSEDLAAVAAPDDAVTVTEAITANKAPRARKAAPPKE